MSFIRYLKERRITDTPAGDFTKDARDDSGMPDVQSWPELRRYLERSGAIPAAIQSGHRVWAAYRAKMRAEAAPDLNQRAKSIVDQVTRDEG